MAERYLREADLNRRSAESFEHVAVSSFETSEIELHLVGDVFRRVAR